MTLREYFTKHPDFKADEQFIPVTDDIATYCGVPFNDALWKQLKANRFDDEIPPDVLDALNTKR